MVPVKFLHIGLTCNDPRKIEKFYDKYLSFKRADVYKTDGAEIIMLSSEEMSLELFKSAEPAHYSSLLNDGYNFSGWRHICFQVDSVDDKFKELGNDFR